MAGTTQNANPTRDVVTTYVSGAVTVATLRKYVVLFPCRIGAVKAYAVGAGTGAGSTVIDVLKNGVSIWATAGNRPTLATASTGEFTNTAPTTRSCQPGDLLEIAGATIPASAGHTDVSIGVALNLA